MDPLAPTGRAGDIAVQVVNPGLVAAVLVAAAVRLFEGSGAEAKDGFSDHALRACDSIDGRGEHSGMSLIK